MRQLKSTLTKATLNSQGCLFLLIMIFLCSGCGGSSNYDLGYEDGWEGTKDSLLYSLSESYKNGYEDGADDAYYFDLGCYDGDNSDDPKYPNMTQYMRGYNECK